MPKEVDRHYDFGGLSEIRRPVIGTSKPTNAREIGFDKGRLVYHDGTQEQQVASVSDVVSASNFRGGWGTASLPTAALVSIRRDDPLTAGQFLLVTAAITIAGLGGADSLEAGDLIYLLGTEPALAGSWHGISRSLDLSPYQLSSSVVLASLPANTPTLIPAPATMLTVNDFRLTIGRDVANDRFDEQFLPTGSDRGVTLTSLTAKSNINCIYTGLAI